MRGLGNLLCRFGKSKRGNAVIIFSLSIPAVFGTAGMAIDFSRAQSAKSTAQATLDAAMLSVSRKTTIDDAAIKQTIESFFNSAGTLKHNGTISSVNGQLESSTRLTGTLNLTVPTTLMNVLGHKQLVIPLKTTIEKGLGNVEIALVLDTTGSMAGTKLDNVKTAATDLIDQIYALPNASDKIKVALVPFAQYVNVGMANRNASWMAVPPDTTTTTMSCGDTYPSATSSNCRQEWFTSVVDGVSTTYQAEVCDWDWGSPVNTCTPVTNTVTWNGCAGARANPLNIKDADYGSRIPGIRNVSCPNAIMPLTKDPSTIRDNINSMYPSGDTYIPAGLAWGWRVLSNREPFTESADDPATTSGQVRKYLVLMTDGQNTRSPRYPEGDHEGNDTALANQLTIDACKNIRADTASKIEIFTIAFQVTDEAIKTILRDECATPGGAFFDAVDYSKLLSAFSEIGSSVSVARISR